MLSFGWDLADYEKKNLFVYLEYTPEQVKKVLIEGGGTIDSVVSKLKAKRLVIDSVTSFSLLYHEDLAKKEAALALFDLIASWGCTALLTAQDTSMGSAEISSAIEFEVDSIILIYHTKVRGERVRAIEILKMRGTRIPRQTFAMNITAKGVEVSNQKVIF